MPDGSINGGKIDELAKRFIISSEEKEKILENILEKILDLGVKVAKDGHVFIDDPKLTQKEKVFLVVAARYVAHMLDEGIPEQVTVREVSVYSGVKEEVASARLKELTDDKYLVRIKKGVYKAQSLARIRNYLREIQSRKREKRRGR